MTDVHSARVEAAARAMAEWDGFDFDATETKFVEASGVFKNTYRDGALGALNAADAVVTAEMIAEVVRAEIVAAVGECVCHEAYTIRNLRDPHCEWHSLGESFAEDTARAVHALLTGEEA